MVYSLLMSMFSGNPVKEGSEFIQKSLATFNWQKLVFFILVIAMIYISFTIK